MKTVDATGAVVNSYTYDIYGKKTSSTGSQPNEFAFAGQQTDPTGLQYLRARYYDPATGTFLSRDPMAASPGWTQSPYGYAGGNPVNASDPTGLWCKICGSVAKYAASVAADSAAAVGSAVVSGIRASGDAQATSLTEQAAAANAAASSAASSAAACAGDEYCRALVIGGTYAAGIALSAFAPTAGAGAALMVIATAAATASDLNDCLVGSNLGCGMLALDAATLGAASIEGSGIRAGASAGQAPWEAMLQRPSAAVANWSVHTAASGGAEAAQQIWSAIYSTGKWANDGFGDGW